MSEKLPTIKEVLKQFEDRVTILHPDIDEAYNDAETHLTRIMAAERLDEAKKASDIWVNKDDFHIGRYFDNRIIQLTHQAIGEQSNE